MDLALIGNCTIGALIDAQARIVWGCFPALRRRPGVLLRCSRRYRRATASSPSNWPIASVPSSTIWKTPPILVTRLYDAHGGAVEITDFAPRFGQFGRMFRPMMLVRRVRPPARQSAPDRCGCARPAATAPARPNVTWGSNHIRYVAPDR